MRRTRQSEDKRRKLEVAAHLNHYYGDAKKWANCVIDKLTDAAFLCEHDPKRMKDGELFKRRNDLRSELSALVDKGRLLLPNEKEKVIGLWKEGAYRGLRQEALDVAVSGYELVTSIDYNDHGNNKPTREQLISCKRQFASVMQSVLDVRKTAAEVRAPRECNLAQPAATTVSAATPAGQRPSIDGGLWAWTTEGQASTTTACTCSVSAASAWSSPST